MRAGYAPASSSFSPSPFPDIIPSPSRAAPVWRRLPPPRRLSDTAARVVAWRPRPGASPKAAPHGRPGRIARTSVAAHSRCLRATPIRKWPSRSAISGEDIGGAGLSERTGLRRCRPWPRIAAAGEAIGPGTAVRDPLRPSPRSVSSERPQSSTQGPSWGYLKSQFSIDLVNFWRQMPTKWLQDRTNGSKTAPGIPPHRAFCGS